VSKEPLIYEVFDPVTGKWLKSAMSKEEFEDQMKDFQVHYEFLDAELEIVTRILEQNVLDDFERNKQCLD
jgi:hypothetical protein